MKKITSLFLVFVWFFGGGFFAPSQVHAINDGTTCSTIIYQERGGDTCYAGGCIENDTRFYFVIENLAIEGVPYNGSIEVNFKPGSLGSFDKRAAVVDGNSSPVFSRGGVWAATEEVLVGVKVDGKFIPECNASFELSEKCTGANSCETTPTASNELPFVPFELCDQVNDAAQKSKCLECFGDGNSEDGSGIWTAVGCIPTKAESIVATTIKIGLSIGGGITLLLILAGSFQLSISQGDPKKADEAKEQITSAIIGLVFIILSVTILQFIGVTLFQLPGIGG